MTTRVVDLSGLYTVTALSATEMTFDTPESVNGNWNYVDLDGAGTTGYDQTLTLVKQPSLNFDGSGYVVAAVTPTELTLETPGLISGDWDRISNYFPDNLRTGFASPYLSQIDTGNWIGPFTIEMADAEVLVCNFVASQGLYKDNGTKQTAFPISVTVEVTPVNSLDVPIGAAHTFGGTIDGNSSGRDQRALTLLESLPFTGRCRVRVRRTTNGDYGFKGTVVDEVKWVDLYALAPAGVPDFGNVTTVHVRNYATEGATSVKERKINMLVTRKLPLRTGPTSFTPDLHATENIAEILSAICLDPQIGNRSVNELNLDNFYNTVSDIATYFGTTEAIKFGYTFDKSNISFEETVATIAEAIFCTAYRRGSMLNLFFEKATPDSSLLFNHRNKIPGSETRTVRFGTFQDNDGVTYRYIDPTDDNTKEIKLPGTGSVNPQVVDSVGIRSTIQATLHAKRIWNKMRYQNVSVQFDATHEADLLIRGERFLTADNTRHDTWDGEIEAQVVLQLQLSQPFEDYGALDHSIFLQHVDGTVESIPIASVTDATHIVLAHAPRLALAIGDNLYHNAAYEIAGNSSSRSSAFILTEREPKSNFTSTVTAINYDDRYYQNDLDFDL